MPEITRSADEWTHESGRPLTAAERLLTMLVSANTTPHGQTLLILGTDAAHALCAILEAFDPMATAVKEGLELERESHRLWDDSFTNLVMANPGPEAKERYLQRRYEATRKHAVAVELFEKAIAKADEL